jgi:hypothetical protein
MSGCTAEDIESAVRKIGSELADMSVRELGDLAARVAEDPGVADSVLAAHGVDVEQIESMLEELGTHAETFGAALADLPISDLGDLASRIADDRSVADSVLTANGMDAGELDEVLDRIGPDAEALAAWLTTLREEQGRQED